MSGARNNQQLSGLVCGRKQQMRFAGGNGLIGIAVNDQNRRFNPGKLGQPAYARNIPAIAVKEDDRGDCRFLLTLEVEAVQSCSVRRVKPYGLCSVWSGLHFRRRHS
jgi:hypothetical protein